MDQSDDDRWALNRMPPESLHRYGITSVSSYRYPDPNGLVHRAVSYGMGEWRVLCGVRVVHKLQELDPGVVTCFPCLKEGG